MSNIIEITACDNQLILIAIEENGGNSFDLCNIKSGYHYKVGVKLQIEEGEFSETFNANGTGHDLNESVVIKLPKGKYSLVYAGVNWGASYNFNFDLNNKNYNLKNNPNKPLTGVIWSQGNENITFEVLQKEMSLS